VVALALLVGGLLAWHLVAEFLLEARR